MNSSKPVYMYRVVHNMNTRVLIYRHEVVKVTASTVTFLRETGQKSERLSSIGVSWFADFAKAKQKALAELKIIETRLKKEMAQVKASKALIKENTFKIASLVKLKKLNPKQYKF